MRYYSITISPKSSTSTFNPITYSTLTDSGGNNGAALRIELDIFQAWAHQPAQAGSLTIHGVDFSDLKQSANFNGANISISVGMSDGLPFSNPAQRGEVISGTILQSYGNWQGTDVNLNLIIIPSTVDPSERANLSFNWQKGQSLSLAVQQTLKTAYPLLNFEGGFSSQLVNTETQPGQYFTLKSFSSYVNDVSKNIIQTPGYLGASIAIGASGFIATDGTIPALSKINVEYTDIIGNLTWIDVATMQAKLVMRSDLNIGSTITFPVNATATNTAANFSQSRNLLSFDGNFLITKIRHVGSSRQADANSWVSIVDCIIP